MVYHRRILFFSSNQGRILENNVLLHLRRLYREIFYFRKNKECDFHVRERGGIKLCIQVTSELNNDNKEREISGLLEAMEEVKLDEGLIITYDHSSATAIFVGID